MTSLRWFFLGAASAAAVTAASGWIYLKTAAGFSARETPGPIERWMARTARASAIPASARALKNPVANRDSTLTSARAHWADHCAGCHANNGSGEIAMGRGMYPPAPDMRLAATQQLTDGELYFMIQNGIRLTGMPAWGEPGTDGTASWELVHFIRHLPHLSFEEEKSMEKLNPKSRAEFAQEDAMERFLKGEQVDVQSLHSHHH